MKYYIENIDRYKEAIKNNPNFYIKEIPEYGFGVINYLVSSIETFPPIDSLDSILLRNCRGIKFDLNTGKILALPHHKFFNLNEREECLESNIDFTEDHYLLEKLDGSMIHPIITDNLYWCTKMGVTDVAQNSKEFIDNSESNYIGLAKDLLDDNFTPIFEWCSNKNRIVVNYPEDALILTEVRNNFNGEYINHEDLESIGEKYNIPVVKKYSNSHDISSYLNKMSSDEDSEGYIIKFDDKKLKIKNEWYISRHRAISNLVFEKDILQMIFKSEIDDIKPFLNDDMRNKINDFELNVINGLREFLIPLYDKFLTLYENNPVRRDFANSFDKKADWSFMFFELFNEKTSGKEVDLNTMINISMKHLGKVLTTSTRVNNFRHWFGGIKWDSKLYLEE